MRPLPSIYTFLPIFDPDQDPPDARERRARIKVLPTLAISSGVLMPREVVKATAWGLAVTIVLALLIVFGSRRLAHFDAALVAYTAAILFATFGLTYRYSM